MSTLTDPSGPALAGIDMPPEQLARAAQTLGLPLAGGDRAGIVLSPRGDAQAVREAFATGAWAFIQVDDAGMPPAAMPSLAVRDYDRLLISLTTRAAFSLDTAVLLCDALVDWCVLEPSRRHEVELAIHEAISNAIIHGNLGIDRGPSAEADSFNQFYTLVQDRLSQPTIAARSIRLQAVWGPDHLTVTVMDEGSGFVTDHVSVARLDAKSGRGLQIIREIAEDIAFSDGGRSVSLRFRR
ncbi:MAG: hypothetical protein RLY86_1852 [Pseudomonadota bacterium]